ncbi:hypothetical protein [Streptomyces puniciscabiei]|uniref:hypothetical protein n=1 Tax=Streptomyces puniciscabiei TaxID=164348 RepID=UPI003326E806
MSPGPEAVYRGYQLYKSAERAIADDVHGEYEKYKGIVGSGLGGTVTASVPTASGRAWGARPPTSPLRLWTRYCLQWLWVRCSGFSLVSP